MITPASDRLRGLIVTVHAAGTKLQQTEIDLQEVKEKIRPIREQLSIVHHELKRLYETTYTGNRERVRSGLASPSGTGRNSVDDLRSQIEDSVSILKRVVADLETEAIESIDIEEETFG